MRQKGFAVSWYIAGPTVGANLMHVATHVGGEFQATLRVICLPMVHAREGPELVKSVFMPRARYAVHLQRSEEMNVEEIKNS